MLVRSLAAYLFGAVNTRISDRICVKRGTPVAKQVRLAGHVPPSGVEVDAL